MRGVSQFKRRALTARVDKPWKEEAAGGIYGVYGERVFAALGWSGQWHDAGRL